MKFDSTGDMDTTDTMITTAMTMQEMGRRESESELWICDHAVGGHVGQWSLVIGYYWNENRLLYYNESAAISGGFILADGADEGYE